MYVFFQLRLFYIFPILQFYFNAVALCSFYDLLSLCVFLFLVTMSNFFCPSHALLTLLIPLYVTYNNRLTLLTGASDRRLTVVSHAESPHTAHLHTTRQSFILSIVFILATVPYWNLTKLASLKVMGRCSKKSIKQTE